MVNFLQPKKILFLSGGAYVSGMEIVTLSLMRGLLEQGYEVQCIFNGWDDGEFKKKLDNLGVINYPIKIGFIYIRKPFWTLDTLIHYPGAYFRCKKIIKSFNPDIFQLCNFTMPIMLYPLINKKAIYNLQESYKSNLKGKSIFKLLNRKVKYFTAVSGHIATVLEGLNVPNEKIKLIFNGIDTKARDVNKTNSQINPSFRTFSIVGQIVPWKGHLVLLDAVEILVQRGIVNFAIQIFGNDQSQFASSLKKLIKSKELEEYFLWMGYVSDQNVIYSNSEVIIIPSLSEEPCSLTIIESMARAKGIIASNRGGNPELIDHNNNGLIFDPEKPSELAEHMDYFIKNKMIIVEFGKNAGIKAHLNYDYLRMTRQYIDLYER